MSQFTDQLDVRHGGEQWRDWELLQNLVYEAGEKGSRRFIIVPKGFRTDGASVPRCLWAIFPSTGRYMRAAVLHDYLYSRLRGGLPHPEAASRRDADRELRLAMAACGVDSVSRFLIWGAVRLFGGQFAKREIACPTS